MKNSLPLFIIFWFASLGVFAQASETVRVKSGEQLSASDKYLYPQFTTGTVLYRDGRTVSAKLNFNLLLREMQFLNTPRLEDTLAISQEYTIRHVKINDDIFIHDQKAGFLKVLGDYGKVRLVTAQSLQVGNVDKEGGYGQSSGVSSIKAISNLPNANSSITPLSMKGDVMYSHRASYFLADEGGVTYPANRKTVLKLYPKHKNVIDDYLKENTVQFSREGDLKKLLEFSDGLK